MSRSTENSKFSQLILHCLMRYICSEEVNFLYLVPDAELLPIKNIFDIYGFEYG